MEKVLLAEGVENAKAENITRGLFGEELVIVDDVKDEPCDCFIGTKITKTEKEGLLGWAHKFNMSPYKFLRHCLKQQIKELEMLYYN